MENFFFMLLFFLFSTPVLINHNMTDIILGIIPNARKVFQKIITTAFSFLNATLQQRLHTQSG